MDFPQYRKYLNGSSYFKILSESEFIEYKWSIDRIEQFRIKANILPDRNYLQDMLNQVGGYWLECGEEEFLAFLDKNRSD